MLSLYAKWFYGFSKISKKIDTAFEASSKFLIATNPRPQGLWLMSRVISMWRDSYYPRH